MSILSDARSQSVTLCERCERSGLKRVVWCGEGELAEIALLAASGTGVTVVAVVAAPGGTGRCHGVPVVQDRDDAEAHDGVVITDARLPQQAYEQLHRQLPQTRIFAPALLRITPNRADLLAAGHDRKSTRLTSSH